MRDGCILNIQRYSTHDGPGIRTTVFLKGCPLHCLWCHNPESQSFSQEPMTDFSRCVSCGACKPVCKSGGPFPAGEPLCLACGACAQACPSEARSLAGFNMNTGELYAAVYRDRIFFDESGGGITLSGGEPLAQGEFCIELLRRCRESGIHTAIETCGYADKKTMLEVCAQADLVLFDLKGIDDERHKKNTGVSVQPILENLKALEASRARIWLRIPLVPAFNAGADELEGMAEFASSLGRIERLYLLPYHRLGEGKLTKLGRLSAAAIIETPGTDAMEIAAAHFREFGLNVYIGG